MSIAPPELVALTLSHLEADKPTLQACALVNSTWAALARPFLFGGVKLPLDLVPWEDQQAMQSLDTILPYMGVLAVRKALLSCVKPDESATPPVLDAPHLGRLALRMEDAPQPCGGDADVRPSVLLDTTLFAGLTHLELWNVEFEDSSALLALLAGFTNLERLDVDLSRVQTTRAPVPACSWLRLRTFRAAPLTDPALVRILLGWIATAEQPRLEAMTVELNEMAVTPLRDVLEACQATLRTLAVQIPGRCNGQLRLLLGHFFLLTVHRSTRAATFRLVAI
jgi:hypothetical protein